MKTKAKLLSKCGNVGVSSGTYVAGVNAFWIARISRISMIAISDIKLISC
jgi:hypothetical protein